MFEKRESRKKIRNGGLLADVRIQEADDAYLISTELPGIHKDDIRVGFLNGVLTIGAGPNERSFFLSDHLRSQDMRVSFENNMLSITIPFAPNMGERAATV